MHSVCQIVRESVRREEPSTVKDSIFEGLVVVYQDCASWKGCFAANGLSRSPAPSIKDTDVGMTGVVRITVRSTVCITLAFYLTLKW